MQITDLFGIYTIGIVAGFLLSLIPYIISFVVGHFFKLLTNEVFEDE